MELKCDRCKNIIGDLETNIFVSTYYEVENYPWKKFSNPGEKTICNKCMKEDPHYIKMYGKEKKKKRMWEAVS